jgi:peptide chain release factor subunit 1
MTAVNNGHEWVFERLEAFMDGGLAEEETAEVAAHLADCPLCQRRTKELRTVEAAYAAAPTEAPSKVYSAELLQRLRDEPEPRRFDIVTPEQLLQLKALDTDGYPVLSLYMDVTPAERQGRKYLAKFKQMSRDAHERLNAEDKAYRHAYQALAEQVQSWLTYGYDETGRGLALFCAQDLGLWRAFRLPVAVRDRLVFADRPYVRPLVALVDEYERYAVLLVDKQTARLFVVHMGEIEEQRELLDELVPRPQAGGWSAEKHQRHHDMHVLWHVKRAAEVLERTFQARECQWLVIGGTAQPLAELRNQLSKSLKERLAGEISLPLSAGPDEVLEAVLEIERETERQVEQERVDALIGATLKGGPAVLGLADTLMALIEGRVMTLIVAPELAETGFECRNCGYLTSVEHADCPLCGQALVRQEDIVEIAVERALDQEAQVEVVRGEARSLLAQHGHIGALLRY